MLPPAEGTGNLCFLLSWEDPLEPEQLPPIPPPPLSLGFGAFGVTWTRLLASLGESKELQSCLMWEATAKKAACSLLCLAALASPSAPEL